MKKQILRRLFSFFIVFSVFISFLADISVSSFAVSSLGIGEKVYNFLGEYIFDHSLLGALSEAVDFRFQYYDDVSDDPAKFDAEISRYNTSGWLNRLLASNPDVWEAIIRTRDYMKNGIVPGELKCHPKEDSAHNNIVRLAYPDGTWIVDPDGNYPYCSKEAWDAYKSQGRPISSTVVFDGRWLTTNSIRASKKTVQKSYADMDATKADLANKYPNSSVTISTLKIGGLECKVIRRLEEGPGNRDWVWCDPNGIPYVYIDPDTQGAAQDWNYDKIQEITDNQTQDIKDIVIEQGDKIDKLIDIDTNTTLAPNVSLDPSLDIDSLLKLNIDKITIDRSDDRTIYTVDSHDVTYNVDLDYYEYNYYTYNYEFTYNNTYVTYIGSTAEYQPKEWSLYYQLPDGRSSADLTEEDVAGLSFQFQDVVNYRRASTSADLWVLYHFDGNTDDDSYYAADNSFSWQQGASINYMEANAFGGALYMDEQPHSFKLTLPSGLGTRDFTLQWRYYQNSAVTSENADNYISAGGKELLRWSEKNLYLSGATQPCENRLSIGSWQELALVRSGGTLYLYHNGVAIAQTPISNALGKELTFYLGGSSRAYSMIDELRLITRPIASGGNYTPTAVPYDSNSVLVLPGESVVTDSYYKWDTTIAPVLSFDVEKDSSLFHEFGTIPYGDYNHPVGLIPPVRNKIYTVNNPDISSDGSLLTLHSGSDPWNFPMSSSYNSVTYNYTAATNIGSGTYTHPGVLMVLSDPVYKGRVFNNISSLALTFVGADLERYTMVLDGVTPGKSWTSHFAWGSVTACYEDTWEDDYLTGSLFYATIQLNANSTFAFRYIEVVPGSQPNTGHQLVTDTYNSADLRPNTAAVQTDIPIKGYTVGGVRPTFPSRGDVWFPAESNRISGVQVYNGQAWEETNARWWTGKRWIPIYAFDLVTLADMWDVGSSTGQDVTPTITTEVGFWNWWKNQWLEFRAWLEATFGKCKHDYEEEILREPTCTQQGAAMYTCSKCRDSYIDTLDPLGHDWVLTETVPDTVIPTYVDVTDQFIVLQTNVKCLVDGDSSTYVQQNDTRDPIGMIFQFKTSYFLDSVSKVECDWFYDGEIVTTSVLTPPPHFDEAGKSLSYSVAFNSDCYFKFGLPHSTGLRWPLSYYQGLNSSDRAFLSEVRFYTDGESEAVPGTGYDIYTCSRCGKVYEDHDGSGPPANLGEDDPSGDPDTGDSSLVTLIQDLFDAAGDLVGKLIGWVFDLAAEAMEGFGKLGDYFAEKAEEVKGFGGQYAGFLGVFFEAIPSEIKSCISIALILLGISLFVRKVLM